MSIRRAEPRDIPGDVADAVERSAERAAAADAYTGPKPAKRREKHKKMAAARIIGTVGLLAFLGYMLYIAL